MSEKEYLVLCPKCYPGMVPLVAYKEYGVSTCPNHGDMTHDELMQASVIMRTSSNYVSDRERLNR